MRSYPCAGQHHVNQPQIKDWLCLSQMEIQSIRNRQNRSVRISVPEAASSAPPSDHAAWPLLQNSNLRLLSSFFLDIPNQFFQFFLAHGLRIFFKLQFFLGHFFRDRIKSRTAF